MHRVQPKKINVLPDINEYKPEILGAKKGTAQAFDPSLFKAYYFSIKIISSKKAPFPNDSCVFLLVTAFK